MDDLGSYLSKAIQLAKRVEVLLASDSNPIPTVSPESGVAPEAITMPTHHGYTVGMYARTRSYFRATLVLAEGGFADEALALGRSLFEDSLRLAVLAKIDDEVDRVDGLIGWLLDGVRRAIGLYREAGRLGVGDDHEVVIDHLEEERRKMVGYRGRRGSGQKAPAIFSEQQLKKAALDDGRFGAWWLHEVGDQMVHGNYFAHRLRHVRADNGIARVAIRDSHPGALIDVIAYAVESVVVSHQNICAILDLPMMPELDDLVSALEDIQEDISGT